MPIQALAAPAPKHGPNPPAIPHTLVGMGGEDSIALRWMQDGPVDHWTVYLDALDGSDIVAYTAMRPLFEVTDLAPGDHEIGVVAWRDGTPSPGPGTFIVVSVHGPRADGPATPVVHGLVVDRGSVTASWEACGGLRCEARLVDHDGVVVARAGDLSAASTRFAGLLPETVYGAQVRCRRPDGPTSSWSTARWTCTPPSLAPHASLPAARVR